jgi:hypothetical protein
VTVLGGSVTVLGGSVTVSGASVPVVEPEVDVSGALELGNTESEGVEEDEEVPLQPVKARTRPAATMAALLRSLTASPNDRRPRRSRFPDDSARRQLTTY